MNAWRCGCRRRSQRPPTSCSAALAARFSPGAAGWRWSCIAAPTIARSYRGCCALAGRHWAAARGRAATCTCTCAHAGRCRTCSRRSAIGCTVDQAGWRLYPNGERHLRPLAELRALYPPALLTRAWRSPSAAASHWRSCATNIRPSSCRRAHARASICAPSPRPVSRGAGRRAYRRGARADRARAGADRRAALRAFLPDRARHGALRAQKRHPLPGPRLGRQLRGLLCARHHRDRPGAHATAVRALHQPRAQRAARYRRRLRARAARGGHPVHLRQIRPRARRARRHRDLLSHTQRHPRRGARARHRRRRHRPPDPHCRCGGSRPERCSSARPLRARSSSRAAANCWRVWCAS